MRSHSATANLETAAKWLSATLSRGDVLPEAFPEECCLNSARALDQFLSGVEKRAYRLASIALRDPDEALDVVQDAMLQLARRYADRPYEEWLPLFYRILQNRIRDSQRRRSVRNRIFGWWPAGESDDDAQADAILAAPSPGTGPEGAAASGEALKVLELAVAELPARQAEAFLLRTLEGLDVADTAAAMGCSEGSVKTHYSRAIHALRARLGEAW